jgi:hypothetical protein
MAKEVLVPEIVGENILADPKRSKWVLNRVDELSKVIKGAYVELTELLYEVAQNQYYKNLKNADGEKYGRFEEYVEDRLGWKERKGRYFVAIHKNLAVEGGVSKEALADLDWSKASQLARLPKDERQGNSLEKWVKKAKEMTHPELQAEVNKAKNKVETERQYNEEVTIKESFGLYPDQHKNVTAALELAERISGSNVKSNCLDMICLEFNASRAEEASVKLKEHLDTIKRVFEVEIVAVKIKGDTEQIVYGKSYMKKHGLA